MSQFQEPLRVLRRLAFRFSGLWGISPSERYSGSFGVARGSVENHHGFSQILRVIEGCTFTSWLGRLPQITIHILKWSEEPLIFERGYLVCQSPLENTCNSRVNVCLSNATWLPLSASHWTREWI
jgi:hypothetical protein